MNKLKSFAGLVLLCATFSARAQVTGIRYGLAYDTTACHWTVYMKVTGSTTSSTNSRIPGTGKVTLVVTTGTTVGTTVYPNQPRNGTGSTATPVAWALANPARSFTTPPTVGTNLSGYTVYDYNPPTSNVWYSPLNNGDSVTLFGLDISTATCGSNIRLWVNGSDPASGPYTGGNDYNNGLLIGSATQLYVSNFPTVGPPKPSISATRGIVGSDLKLEAVAFVPGGCTSINTSSFQWTGPNSYAATGQNQTRTPITAAFFGTYSVSVSDNLGCSNTFALAALPLPVTISSFKGNAVKCAAVLAWETASETNFDRFEVQYSADGKSYMTVGEVASNKLKTGSAYSYTYGQPSGKGLYRLKMIDLGGLTTYSESVSIQTSCGNAAGDISIAPNPTTGFVSIRGISSGAEVRVIDMLGKVVSNEIATGAALNVNLSSYANGVYNVLVSQNGGWEKVGQIVKN